MAHLIKERVKDEHAIALRQYSLEYNAAKKIDNIENRRNKIRLMGEIVSYCNANRLLNDLLCPSCAGSKELADSVAAIYGAPTAVVSEKKAPAPKSE